MHRRSSQVLERVCLDDSATGVWMMDPCSLSALGAVAVSEESGSLPRQTRSGDR
jgi:hypothetical protein